MTRIVAVAPVLPEFHYSQAEITAELAPLLTVDPSRRAVLERVHGSARIGERYTALPIESYRDLGTFRESNEHFIRIATDLLERALRTALETAGLAPADVTYVVFTSVTGIAAPSIDALLVSRLGLRPDVKRMPSYGLGCVGGAAGIARVHDYLVGHPTEVAVLLSVELCSLTLQRQDETMANFVATGLFGDGAAAVVMVGDEHPLRSGPTVVDTRSAIYPETSEVIGFNVGGTGFEIVLTAGVAEVIEKNFPAEVDAFLENNDLTTAEIDHWIAHPGGPKILDAFDVALGLPGAPFALSWDSLAAVGNLSSASVLHVLADTMEKSSPQVGDLAMLFALGPGVSAEFVLLEWRP